MAGRLDTLATAYALIEEPRYARGAKAILLRFADVFPEYLVRAGYGYGEYAGMDPHVASERINNLPEDELVYPPNKPDRKIYTGYWSASRIGTSGMDGGWNLYISKVIHEACIGLDEAGTTFVNGFSQINLSGTSKYSPNSRNTGSSVLRSRSSSSRLTAPTPR